MSTSSSNEGTIRIGFLGCGTIAQAIATGLITSPEQQQQQQGETIKISSVSVTRRSESKSSLLRESYPDLVTVYDDPQDVVDHSDVVYLCVLPKLAEGIVGGISFDRERHILISLVSTFKFDNIVRLSKLHAENVYKMICLPSVSRQQNVSLLLSPQQKQQQDSPSLPLVQTLCQYHGGYVRVSTEEDMSTMMVPTGLMGPMYGLLKNNRDWLIQRGISSRDATYWLVQQYKSMLLDADERFVNVVDGEEQDGLLEELIEEQTPGGLNEQGLKNLEGQGVFGAYDLVMDSLLSRLQGKSDGWIQESSE